MRIHRFRSASLVFALSFVVCLGSDHHIRHFRSNQRRFQPSPFTLYEKSSSSLGDRDLWLLKPQYIASINSQTTDFWSNSGRNEMKKVQNFFKNSEISGISSNSETTARPEETKILKKKSTGVMIKFSGKNFQDKSTNLYSTAIKSRTASRPFLNPVVYPKSNETSLWPLTYSPGTVEAALNNTSINITSQSGKTAFLPCRVGHLGDTQISWIRRRDWHVITSGDNLYTYDQRFSVAHDTSSHDWTLQIRWVNNKDEGTYECQVSTGTGIISLFVNLRIITPQAKIIGQGQYHVNRGSPISLTCIIQENLIPPQHVLWHKNGELLNFMRNRQQITITTEKPQVKYTIKDSFGPSLNFTDENKIMEITSHLRVGSAHEVHAGNYSCSAPDAAPASILVFITEGDKIAAVQRIDSSAESSCRSNIWEFLIIFLTLIPYR